MNIFTNIYLVHPLEVYYLKHLQFLLHYDFFLYDYYNIGAYIIFKIVMKMSVFRFKVK